MLLRVENIEMIHGALSYMTPRYFISVLVGLLAGVGCHRVASDLPDGVVDDVTDGSDGESVDSGGAIDGGSTDDGESSDGDGSSDDGESTDDTEMDPPGHYSGYGPVQGSWPAAAFDGTSYLAVWEDHRLRRPVLYAGRVTADGTALDPFGFRILDVLPEALSVGEYEPDVAFDGENFLVVTQADGRIVGVRVSPAGEVLDPGGILIADSAEVSRPSLVFDGEQYRVAWGQLDPGSEGIFQARVGPNGTVLDPGGVFVYEPHESENDYLQPGVSASFDGTNVLLSWVTEEIWNFDEIRVLYASRTAADGTPIDETPVRLSFEGEDVRLHAAGFDGATHVIAWASTQDWIRASRVTPGGTLLDPGGFLVYDGGEYYANDIHRLDMAAGNGRSIVVWSREEAESSDYPDPVRVATIATDRTTKLHPDNAFPRASEATVAAHPDGALLLWRQGQLFGYFDHAPIVGTRLDAIDMPVGGAVAPASPASRQEVEAVASDGQNFFVLWTDTRDPSGWALYGARIDADGTPLDAESLQFSAEIVFDANVVFDGANFVVSWTDPPKFGDGDWCSQLNTVRVSPAGERLDVQPLKPPLFNSLAGASDGTHTLLAGDPCNEASAIGALLLDQGGAMVSDLVSIPQYGHPLVAAFDGIGYLMVWPHWPQVFGQRITQAGALEGQAFVIADAVTDQVSIAAGGGNNLVVWDTDSEIRATRVSSDGQVLDPDGILVAALENSPCGVSSWHTCSLSSVVFDGENFVVAWRERSIPGQANSLDLYAATVSPEGVVSPRFPISQEPEREGAPYLAVNGEGQVLAAYSRFMPGPPYDTRRAVATPLP